jgi:hypothetical protein
MSAPVIGVSESTVREVWGHEDLDAFMKDNAVTQVSVPIMRLK